MFAKTFDCAERDDEFPDILDHFFEVSDAVEIGEEEESSSNTRTLVTIATRGTAYIFTSSSVPIECRGVIAAVEYCYAATQADFFQTMRHNQMKQAFHFLSLSQDEDDNLVVDDIIIVTTKPMRNTICTNDNILPGAWTCCDKYTLPTTSQISISSSPFSFGIVVDDAGLLSFTSSQEEYSFSKFQISLDSEELEIGRIIETSDEELEDQSLLLLRFIIGMHW